MNLFIWILGWSLPASFAMTALPCKSKSSFTNIKSLAHKISIIGEEDRSTFEAYAKKNNYSLKDLNKKFEATGRIVCDGKFGVTASVVGARNVIVTAGHLFYEDDCKKRNWNSCVFELYDGRKKEVNLNSLNSPPCDPSNIAGDWAVMKLASSVDVNPYEIPTGEMFPQGEKLIQVSAPSDNYRKRSITNCSIKDVGRFKAYPIQTDCDGGFGTSGSPQFVEKNGKLILQSIFNSSSTTDFNEYESDKAFNVSVPMSGKFIEAVRGASGLLIKARPATTTNGNEIEFPTSGRRF